MPLEPPPHLDQNLFNRRKYAFFPAAFARGHASLSVIFETQILSPRGGLTSPELQVGVITPCRLLSQELVNVEWSL
jgi:hypothetical protein